MPGKQFSAAVQMHTGAKTKQFVIGSMAEKATIKKRLLNIKRPDLAGVKGNSCGNSDGIPATGGERASIVAANYN